MQYEFSKLLAYLRVQYWIDPAYNFNIFVESIPHCTITSTKSIQEKNNKLLENRCEWN